MNTSLLARAARRVAYFFAELNYAQRRMAALRAAPDRYLLNADTAADTYGEFLFRTSGPLPHEPSAARRAHGQLAA